MAKLKHNSPKALNYCFFQEVWLCRKSRVQWAFTPFSEQHVRAPGPRGAFVRLSRAGPAGTEGESRDRQRGWAGTGLGPGWTGAPSTISLPASRGRKFILLELIIGMHFSLVLLSRRKAAVKHSDVCYLWGNFTKGEGRRGAELNGSSCWYSAVLPPN